MKVYFLPNEAVRLLKIKDLFFHHLKAVRSLKEMDLDAGRIYLYDSGQVDALLGTATDD